MFCSTYTTVQDIPSQVLDYNSTPVQSKACSYSSKQHSLEWQRGSDHAVIYDSLLS